MTKKIKINQDEDFYMHKVNQFKENKKDRKIRKEDNTPLLHMHGGEWQVCQGTFSKP